METFLIVTRGRRAANPYLYIHTRDSHQPQYAVPQPRSTATVNNDPNPSALPSALELSEPDILLSSLEMGRYTPDAVGGMIEKGAWKVESGRWRFRFSCILLNVILGFGIELFGWYVELLMALESGGTVRLGLGMGVWGGGRDRMGGR